MKIGTRFIYQAFFGVFTLWTAYLVARQLPGLMETAGISRPFASTLLMAVAAYGFGHALRIFRLWLMLIENPTRLRVVAAVHFHTAWATAVLPFKSGEIFRVSELTRVAKSPLVGLTAFALEKVFDAVVLLILAVIAGLGGVESASFRFFALLTATLVVSIMVLWSALPQMIRFSRPLVLMASRSKRGVFYLRWIALAEKFYELVRSALHARLGILLMLSLLSWGCDALAFIALNDVVSMNADSLMRLFVGTIRQAVEAAPSPDDSAMKIYIAMTYLFLSAAAVPSLILSIKWWRTSTRPSPLRKPYVLLPNSADKP